MIGRPLVIALLSLAAPAAASQSGVDAAMDALMTEARRLTLSGTLGGTVIGMSFALRGRDEIVSGHYYRGRNPVDIPLTITRRGDDIIMHDPGGGTFHLRLHGHDDSAPPFDFWNSIGLRGTYVEGNQQRPVRLGFESIVPGEAGGRWYRDVTERPDADYEAVVRRFLEAAIAGDRRAATGAVSFPLRVNGPCPRSVPNRARLLEQWDAIFTPAYVARLRTAIPHEMFVRQGLAMVAHGAVWFDADGAVVLNFVGCPVRRAR